MRNPLRSEAEAFRLLLVVIVGALLVVGAAALDTWLGVAAAIAAVAGIVWWLRRGPEPAGRAAAAGRRVLVVAPPGTDAVAQPAGATEIAVVVPAGPGDELTALSLTRRLSRPGVAVHGEVAAADPLRAVEEALRTFAADEILVAGDDALAGELRGRLDVPVGRA